MIGDELQNFLIAVGRKYAKRNCKNFAASLQAQREARAEKEKLKLQMKMAKATVAYIGASYLYQQYDSP